MREYLEKHNNKLNEQQARDLVDRCLKLLYYRDARAYDYVNYLSLSLFLPLCLSLFVSG